MANTQMSNPQRLDVVNRRRHLVWWLVVGGACATVYTLAVGPYLYSDDWRLFNHFMTGQLTSFDTETWLGFGYGYYRPVASLSLAADIWFFGFDSTALHLVNAALFLLCALAVGRVAAVLAGGHAGAAAVAATLICLLHPAAVESVSWHSCRPNLLSGMFTLFTCLAAMRYARRGRIRHLCITGVVFALALFSKEDALVALPVACLLALHTGRLKRVVSIATVMVGIVILCLAVRALVGIGLPKGDHAEVLATGPIAVILRLVDHLELLFLPHIDTTSFAVRAAGVLGLTVVVIAGLCGRNRWTLGVLAGAITISLLPGVQSILDLLVGVRMIFTAYLFAAVLLGCLAANGLRYPRIIAASVGILVLTSVSVSTEVLGRWIDSGLDSERFSHELLALHDSVPPHETFLLVDAPFNYHGVPTFEYRVSHILLPPFTDHSRIVRLHQAEVAREVVQALSEGFGKAESLRILAWNPELGLVHAPVPAGRDKVIRSWGDRDLEAWHRTIEHGRIQLRSPDLEIAVMAIDRIVVECDRPLSRPPALTVETTLAPEGLRPEAVDSGSVYTFHLGVLSCPSPADRVTRLVLNVDGFPDQRTVRHIRFMRCPRRFELLVALTQIRDGIVLRLGIPEPDPAWRSFRLELFSEEASICSSTLGRNLFSGVPEGGIEWHKTFDLDYFRGLGVRSGRPFFFRMDASGEEGASRARSKVARVFVP